MARDTTLMPNQVLHLCALGTLLQSGPRHYADLATGVRNFTSHIVGPSPVLTGTSLELLRYDGLIEAVRGIGMVDNALLAITDAGKQAFAELMAAPVGPASGDLSKLVITLKLRFLHLLDPARQRAQIDSLVALYQREITRLEELRRGSEDEPGLLTAWLDHDIAQNRRRLEWFEALRHRMAL